MNNIEIKKQLLTLGLITLGLSGTGCAKNVMLKINMFISMLMKIKI